MGFLKPSSKKAKTTHPRLNTVKLRRLEVKFNLPISVLDASDLERAIDNSDADNGTSHVGDSRSVKRGLYDYLDGWDTKRL